MLTKGIKMSVVNLKTTEMHIHHGLQCIFILKGHAVIEVEEEKIYLSAEDLLVINSNQLHAIIADNSNIALVLEIDRDYLSNECTSFAKGRINCHCIGYSDDSSNYYGLKRSLIRILYITLKQANGYQLDFKAELLRFIHILYTKFRIENEVLEDGKTQDKQRAIDNIISYMNDHYDRPLKLEEMAKREYMSPQYFSKYFKRKTGHGFLKYLTELRLRKVMYSLIYTDDSLIKIALEHGFANAKSLNEAFKKEYDDTPGNFRKHHKKGEGTEQGEVNELGLNLEVGVDLKEFIRYLKKYDTNFEEVELKKNDYEIQLDAKVIKEFQLQDNILNIGKIETAGYTNLFKQLESLRDKLGFRYVHFELEHYFILDNVPYSLILCNQFFKAIEQFEKLQMAPFLKLTLDPKYANWSIEKVEEIITKKVETFLQCVSKVYKKTYVEQWKLKVQFNDAVNEKINHLHYHIWYRFVKKMYPRMQIGIYALNDNDVSQKERFFRFVSVAKERKELPEFVAFGVFPSHRIENYMSDQFFYSPLQQYYKEVICAIQDVYREQACDTPPLYMIEWNTLMGDLQNESILYFRSALIVEVLLSLNAEIKGAGYWADSSVSAMYAGEAPMSSLALYLLDDVRRPIHPILEAWKRLGNQIIYEKKNILVSRVLQDEYVILLWNPQYLNPSYSLDDVTIESLRRNVNIKLNAIPQGVYQVKKITCNKNHSGAITQIAEAGYPDITDTEVFDYVKHNIANGLNVYEEYIFNGSYILNTTLLYNSVVMYIMKKKDV